MRSCWQDSSDNMPECKRGGALPADDNGPPGALLDNHLNILWVLVRRAPGPHGWQIVARQTTRIGPSTGTPVMK